jgi:Flp pilus assembly protein TadG
MRRLLRLLRGRSSDQRGYVAILVATLIPTVFIACAAVAVDTGNWYAQQMDIQKAADAAALAGVPYLPNDMGNATTKALDVAKRNGYDDADANVTVVVTLGDRPTQLKVTITAKIPNTFGKVIGVPTATLTRSAVADYQGPQPMGSPCNTFGNEPTSGTGGSSPIPSGTSHGSAPFSNCTTPPQFWGVVEGPETDKIQGDQYQTKDCSGGVDNCASGHNSEYEDYGYSYVVKVQQDAVGFPINLQLYDPEFAETGAGCADLPDATSFPTGTGNLNPWVTKADAKFRYSDDGTQTTPPLTFKSFCNGDYFPGGGSALMNTTFVLRHTTPSNNPATAPVQNDTGGSPCIKQYGGIDPTWNANMLTSGATGYNAQLAEVFHNWTTLCNFTPTEAGDYYLQVRTNVSLGGAGTGLLRSGNSAAAATSGNSTTGEGANTFAMRAVTAPGKETSVAVAGYSHMPIDINAPGSTSTFNLIRVAPGAAGQFISFSFFDAADASGNGSIQILRPTDATGSITSVPFPGGGCVAKGAGAGGGTALSNCTAPVSNSANNGKLEQMTVPIPSDYNCNWASFGGCWYQVKITFNGATSVTDVTTWNATVVGDPIRLIQ